MPAPDTRVNVSLTESATTSVTPTLTVPNALDSVCVLLIVIEFSSVLVTDTFVPALIFTSSVAPDELCNLKT